MTSLTSHTIHHFVTGASRRTRVHVERGALGRAASLCGLDRDSKHLVVTDQTVARLHAATLMASLSRAGLDAALLVVEDGEHEKSLSGYCSLMERALALGPDEGTTIIALGGGKVCNLAGMVAATLFRGVRLVHAPTTVMAQADAAISHKQAVNGPGGKNQIGCYYAPELILADVDTLRTLSRRQIADGMAEVVKHALCHDEELLRGLNDARDCLAPGLLEFAIDRTVRDKCSLITLDPLERAEGLVLQYGHTIGHAIEFVSNFTLGHGESVAIGMVCAARVSVDLGIASESLVDTHVTALQRFGLPARVPGGLPVDRLIASISAGKRSDGRSAFMALCEAPARLYGGTAPAAFAVPLNDVAHAIEACRTLESSAA